MNRQADRRPLLTRFFDDGRLVLSNNWAERAIKPVATGRKVAQAAAAQLVSVTRDKTGTVIDGSPDKVTDVTDVWTFARDVTSRDTA